MPNGASDICSRASIATTLGRLRREIEPVEPRDFARFLFEWQHVGPTSRVSGPEALAGVLAQLEGYEAPAASWEAELLPARFTDYSAPWLDELCTAGRTLWTRLRPRAAEARGSSGGSLRATPILLLPRRAAPLWTELAPAPADDEQLGSRARRVAEYLAGHGASFFADIAAGTHLLRAELEDALAELVVRGRAHGDSFAGLRALLVPPSKRPSNSSGRRGRVAWFGIEDAGRWTLVRPAVKALDVSPSASAREATAASVEHVARILLRRYGVMCWRLMEREPSWLPPWRELVRVYRRLEARGEIRGGRFIAGLSGEQYALPEAVVTMRQVRRQPLDGALVCLAAADPANLLGTLVPGTKVARVVGARVAYRDGVPLATSVGGHVEWLGEIDAPTKAALRRALEGGGPVSRFDAVGEIECLDGLLHAVAASFHAGVGRALEGARIGHRVGLRRRPAIAFLPVRFHLRGGLSALRVVDRVRRGRTRCGLDGRFDHHASRRVVTVGSTVVAVGRVRPVGTVVAGAVVGRAVQRNADADADDDTCRFGLRGDEAQAEHAGQEDGFQDRSHGAIPRGDFSEAEACSLAGESGGKKSRIVT